MMFPSFDQRFVLHIGLSKTATTTLQESVFRHHPNIYYLGKLLLNRELRQARDLQAFEFLKPLLWEHSKSISPDRFSRSYAALTQDVTSTRPVWLASWEELGNRAAQVHFETLRRIRHFAGDFRLLVCLRNPLQRIPSEYLQSLSWHYENFRRNPLKFSNLLRAYYVDLDQWLSQCRRNGYLSILLNTSELIRGSCEILGRQNVGVFLYEDLCRNPLEFHAAMADFIGVDCQPVMTPDGAQGRMNRRITEGQVQYLRELQRSIWRRLGLIRAGKRQRRLLFRAAGDDGNPAKAVLPAPWEQELIAATRDGHRWLAETFNLPLEDYGYPL
jgi:hypothetical protein